MVLTFCIGRHTIQALESGGPVQIGQGAVAIPADSYDAPYKRIAELEAAARDVVCYDWSDNDADAVEAVARLRKCVEAADHCHFCGGTGTFGDEVVTECTWCNGTGDRPSK